MKTIYFCKIDNCCLSNNYGAIEISGSIGNHAALWKRTLYSMRIKRMGHVLARPYPYSGLVFDSIGDLYGMTQQGGSEGSGTIFEITP